MFRQFSILALAMSLFLMGSCALVAQEASRVSEDEYGRDESYYQPPVERLPPQSIIHRKAQVRAAQRQARLASLSWYGMSNARPTASPTPFTTLYSPVWQMPGGRPYAWHYYRPVYFYYTP